MKNEKIKLAKKHIERLQKDQDKIYNTLLKQIRVKKNSLEEGYIFDFVYNDCKFAYKNLISYQNHN